MKRIGMVVALQKEILPLLERLNVKIRKSCVGKFSVAEFDMGGKEVVCVNSGVAFDTSEIDDCPPGKYDGYPDVIIDADEGLLERAERVIGGVQTVVCASADKFVGTVSEKRRIRAEFNADVCDMECAGVLITANANGVPVLIVKAVSDGDGGANDYIATVHEATVQYIDFLINFIKTIE